MKIFKDICRKPIFQHPGLATGLYISLRRAPYFAHEDHGSRSSGPGARPGPLAMRGRSQQKTHGTKWCISFLQIWYCHVHATSVKPSLFCFMGVWDPSEQLAPELASNLPQELCKMVEYDIEFANFRFLAWPSASGHGEYIYIYIYKHLANGSVQSANGSVRILNFAGSVPPASEINFAGPTTWDVKTDTATFCFIGWIQSLFEFCPGV